MARRMSRMASPGWVVVAGQCGTRTVPPVTAAAARNGVALDRSGSTTRSTAAIGPGATRHDDGVGCSTVTPDSRSIASVISMCGPDGTGEAPTWTRSTPSSKRAAESRRPETNCEEAEASISTRPPRRDPAPETVKGRRSPSISAPRARSASSTVDCGRILAAGSPSKVEGPVARAAIGGTKRMTVPASPHSISPPRSGPGVMSRSVSSGRRSPAGPSIRAPRDRRAPIMRSVSRLRRVPVRREGPSARAARGRARLVSDLDPGTTTSASTGAAATGALQ